MLVESNQDHHYITFQFIYVHILLTNTNISNMLSSEDSINDDVYAKAI